MNAYRTLAATALIVLGSVAAQAAEPRMDGDWSNDPVSLQAPSTVTRAQVVAELAAARQNGTMPRSGEWYDEPAPLSTQPSTLTRAEVRAEAVAALKSHDFVGRDH